MLQGFRKVVNSFVGKVFFTILLMTFALLGVGYGFRDLLLGSSGANDAATVGGTKVSLAELDRQYRRQLSGYQKQMGPEFAPTQQQKQELAEAALDHKVDDALYAEAASDAGLRVGDGIVRHAIEQDPAFAGMDKKFDQAHFQMLLEREGMSEAGFVPLVRRDIARQLLTNPIAHGAVAPKSLVEDMYRYRDEQRVAQTVLIADAAATGIPAPTQAELQDFHQKHATEFTAPEYRSFTVLALTPDLFVGEVKPGDDDLRAAYESHKADYVVPEKRRIDQAVVNDKATADAIIKAVQAGKTLADATRAATAGKNQPVSLDLLSRDEFPDALREPVFAAAKGAIVGPVQTLLGWHAVQVTDIRPGHEVSFDEAKPKLLDQARREAAADLLSEQVDKIGDKLLGGAAMESVAAGVNATPVKIGPIDAKGDPAPGGDPKQAKPAPAWTIEAFRLRPGETSSFQDSKDGGYFAVRLDAVTPPALRPLAEIQPDVALAWTAEKRAAWSEQRADALAAKARAGTPMSDIAAEAGSKVETTPAFTRDATDSKAGAATPPEVVDAIFQLSKIGDVATASVPDGRIVAKLTEIRPADPFTADAKLAELSGEIEGGLQADMLAQYRAALRQKYKVKINPHAVETVVGQ